MATTGLVKAISLFPVCPSVLMPGTRSITAMAANAKTLPFFNQQSPGAWSYRARLSIRDEKSSLTEKEVAFLSDRDIIPCKKWSTDILQYCPEEMEEKTEEKVGNRSSKPVASNANTSNNFLLHKQTNPSNF